jgi:hypothetical protein
LHIAGRAAHGLLNLRAWAGDHPMMRRTFLMRRCVSAVVVKGFMRSFSLVMRATIVFSVAIAPTTTAHAAAASCKAAAQHLVKLIRDNWPSENEGAPATPDMIGTFLHKPHSGFVSSMTRLKLATYSRQAFIEQAARIRDGFSPSHDLLKALDEVQSGLTVSALPRTDLLAANSIGGTANCNSTVFFSVGHGSTQVMPGPESWENDAGGSCGLTRSFASVDGTTFVIDDSLDFGPSLASTLTLTPRGNGKWLDPCRADFVFAPHFDTKNTLNDWANLDNWEANDCGTDGCDGFRRATLKLVEQTQADRAGVESHLLAAMTVAQREEYQRLKRVADRPDAADAPADGDAARTAAALTETMPLLLPMLVDDHVFLASVGHFTIGWRVFSDWKVTVDAADADKTREIARFAIGMTQGPIVSATVK